MSKIWEVGSEFHWSDDYLLMSDANTSVVLPHGVLFARARGALAALMRMRAADGRVARLHLPSYFCMDIAEYLASVGEVHWYRHLPGKPADLDTLFPIPGDMVLVLNMFGAETGTDWQHWKERTQVCLIEDHSHDPFSEWAIASRADYAVTSLRKTLPIPDGALLWSPLDQTLPLTGPERFNGANDKLAAMLLKAGYLRGAAITKQAFRTPQVAGEKELDADEGGPAHAFTRMVLGALDLNGLRERRRRNCRLFANALADTPITGIEPVFATVPESCVPFNPVLRFASRAMRDHVRRGLAEHGVFAPIHWVQEQTGFTSDDPEAMALTAQLLTIPLDFRCTPEDVTRVLVALRSAAGAGKPT